MARVGPVAKGAPKPSKGPCAGAFEIPQLRGGAREPPRALGGPRTGAFDKSLVTSGIKH